MRILTKEKRVQVLACLVEGNSILATVRLTGVAKKTVLKLLVDVGEACDSYQNKGFRNLTCKNIQVDEIWSYCYARNKNVPEKFKSEFGYGDVWTFTAIDRDTKLVPSWYIGPRSSTSANDFMRDLSERVSGRVQINTDAFGGYRNAVKWGFDGKADHAQMVKHYNNASNGPDLYAKLEVISTTIEAISGKPNLAEASTSHVERNNLTMRMGMRRFARATNAFSKSVDNHCRAIALHFMHYNFCRIHQSLRITPAMRAGISDHVWSIGEIVSLVEKVSK